MISGTNYILVIMLFVFSVCFVAIENNMIKKLIMLSIAQTGIIMLFVLGGYIENGKAPFIKNEIEKYVDPVPQALMLTAIVVGFTTTAIGLALIIRIKKEFGTIDYDYLMKKIN